VTHASRTVLLVDDDPDVSAAYAEVISEAGYDVVSVHDGRHALDWLETSGRRPCVVLLDLMMPVMDGRQFIRALGTRAPPYDVSVVLMTAHRGDEDVKGDALLQKPVSLDTLLETIARFCRCES
jgi:CheY-like chemotaxis protein